MKRALILGALLTAILAPLASAQTTQTSRAVSFFGLGGLTLGQTVRLNVAFIPQDPVIPSDPIVPVRLRFLNASGQPVVNIDGIPVEQQVQLAPGASAFLDLPGRFVVDAEGERAEVRPVVLVRPRDVLRRLVLSAEVFDNDTGITGVFIPTDPILPVDPIRPLQALSFGLGGVTLDQTVRLNVAFIPQDPIIPSDPVVPVRLRFLNASGQPVVNIDGTPVEQQVQLARGASTFLDLPGRFVVDVAGERAEIRPVVVARPRDVKHLVLSAEVFDNDTGITGVFLPQDPIRSL